MCSGGAVTPSAQSEGSTPPQGPSQSKEGLEKIDAFKSSLLSFIADLLSEVDLAEYVIEALPGKLFVDYVSQSDTYLLKYGTYSISMSSDSLSDFKGNGILRIAHQLCFQCVYDLLTRHARPYKEVQNLVSPLGQRITVITASTARDGKIVTDQYAHRLIRESPKYFVENLELILTDSPAEEQLDVSACNYNTPSDSERFIRSRCMYRSAEQLANLIRGAKRNITHFVILIVGSDYRADSLGCALSQVGECLINLSKEPPELFLVAEDTSSKLVGLSPENCKRFGFVSFILRSHRRTFTLSQAILDATVSTCASVEFISFGSLPEQLIPYRPAEAVRGKLKSPFKLKMSQSTRSVVRQPLNYSFSHFYKHNLAGAGLTAGSRCIAESLFLIPHVRLQHGQQAWSPFCHEQLSRAPQEELIRNARFNLSVMDSIRPSVLLRGESTPELVGTMPKLSKECDYTHINESRVRKICDGAGINIRHYRELFLTAFHHAAHARPVFWMWKTTLYDVPVGPLDPAWTPVPEIKTLSACEKAAGNRRKSAR
jgi:hypothetical protein